MHRTEATGKDDDLFGAGKDGYEDKNVGGGIAGTQINADTMNAIQEEIVACIEGQGGTLLTAATETRDQLNEHGTRAGTGVFGDGSDGDVTLGSNTTLTRDMYYKNLTLGAFWLDTAGFRVFVQETLTIDGAGYVHRNGNDGQSFSLGWAGGAAAAAGSLQGGASGGSGGNGGVGTNGSNQTDAFGGAGGDAGGVATGGTVTAVGATSGSIRDLTKAQLPLCIGEGGSVAPRGGAGGAGGDDKGGGGGGGAGVCYVAARNVVLTGSGGIYANGGIGGDADVGPDGDGGGGGGGGLLILICRTEDVWANVTVTGGTAGTGIGTGSAGVAGSDGLKLRFYA